MHGSPSLQLIGVPKHDPFEHRSFVVQLLLSLQTPVLKVWLQIPPEQESLVHGLLSLHCTAEVQVQVWAASLHVMPELHGGGPL